MKRKIIISANGVILISLGVVVFALEFYKQPISLNYRAEILLRSEADKELSGSIENKIEEYIKKEGSRIKIERLNIVSSYKIDHGMLFVVQIESGREKYEGLYQTEQETSEKVKEMIT